MPYVGLENIESQSMRLLEHGYARDVRSSSNRFSKGDVLYGKMRPYLNKVWVAEFDGLCSAEFLVFQKREGLESQFLAMRLNAEDFVAFANGQVSGERPRVDFKKLSRFSILLPPAPEQERIVVKINAALSRVGKGDMAARRAQKRLERYRVAVLDAAVTGELTRDWREGRRDSDKTDHESGEALLQRLMVARRAYWETNEQQRFRERSQVSKGDKWKSRYPEPVPASRKNRPKLPDNWTWASLDQLSIVVRGASPRPAGDPRYFGGKIPWITVGSLTRDSQPYLTKTTETLTESGRKVSRYVAAETLLLTNSGATLGVPKISKIAGCINDGVAALLAVDYPLKLYLYYLLAGQTQTLRAINQGAAQPNLNTEIIRAIGVALPPLAEQTVIIQEVKRRLAAADRLAVTLDRQLARVRATRQSLLHEAFAGSLVPQNANDEPASLLLERIRTERARIGADRRQAHRGFQPATKMRRDSMKEQPPSTEAFRIAWERIGKKADARRLFDEAGFGQDHVVQFYEVLRATPEVLAAFRKGTRESGRQEPVKQLNAEREAPKGNFRLVELWLEDFKNLKDYVIRFNPSQGLDVVLGWNGTGKSNLFEALVIIFRDLHEWWERNRWPDKPMNGFRLSYEVDEHIVEVAWRPGLMKRPELKRGPIARKSTSKATLQPIRREQLPLPRFVFGYYSGPTNRLAEHFLPMKQAHYERLRSAKADDAKTLAKLLEQRRFFCAETHHAKYVLLGFSYKEDPKISDFLANRLRIVGFESALFIIRKPRWAKSGSKPEDFWGATGIMRRVMERLRRYAIAPMVLEQKVSDGYRSTTEDHYYFFLPDLKSLHSFAAEYQDARTFFLALESTDFSELIHDVKIQVRVKSSGTEQVPITFHQLSEGEQQLLMVLGLMRFTKSHQSLVLLDEPDTHLNPHWSVEYLKDLTRVMSDNAQESSEQQTSQILIATHDPLVIASLVKEQVHLLKRDAQTGACKWVPASVNPRGLGFTGILTSEMFGFRSDLDPETLADLDNRVRLIAKEESLTANEKKELEKIDKRLTDAGFSKSFSDPYYAAFVRAWGRRYSELMAGEQFVTPEKRQEIDRIASEVLKEAVAEVEQKGQ